MKSAVWIVAVSIALTGCGGRREDASSRAAENASSAQKPAAAGAGYFTVPAEQMPHLQVVPVARTTWQTVLHTTGTVDWDNDHTTQAITQVSGPIARILVDFGSHVNKGDVLLYVSSPDVSNAVSAYRKAKNRLDLAQRNLDRSKDLLDHKAIAAARLRIGAGRLQRRHDRRPDRAPGAADFRGDAAAKSTDAEQQNVADPPRAGDACAHRGHCRPEAGAARAADPGRHHRRFTISNVVHGVGPGPRLRAGPALRSRRRSVDEMRNASFPTVFHGTVAYIGDLIDPATRTTPVRIVTKNPDGLLKKDHVRRRHDPWTRPRARLLAVPTSAVLYDEQNLPFVYVAGRAGQVRAAAGHHRRPAGRPDRGRRAACKEGDRVVAAGQRLPAVRQQLPVRANA